MRIDLHVTNRCNLQCPHCFLSANRMRTDELSIAEYDKLFRDFTRNGISHVHVTGGEPLIREDIYDIIGLGITNELEIELQTNAVLLSTDAVKRLKGLGVNKIYISLDGDRLHHDARRGEGVFDKATAAIRDCVDNSIEVVVHCCVSKENESSIPNVIRICSDLSVKRIGFMRYNLDTHHEGSASATAMTPQEWIGFTSRMYDFVETKYTGNTQLRFSRWYYLPKHEDVGRKFVGDFDLFFIMSSGDVYLCGLTVGEVDPIGSVREHSIEELLERAKHWTCPTRVECSSCEQLHICGGGCPVQPKVSRTSCSKYVGTYESEEFYPGCPLITRNMVADIYNKRWPRS